MVRLLVTRNLNILCFKTDFQSQGFQRCDLAVVIWALRDPCLAVGPASEQTWAATVLSSPADHQRGPTGALPGSPAAAGAHSPVGGCAQMTHSVLDPFAQTSQGIPLQNFANLHGWTAGAANADPAV